MAAAGHQKMLSEIQEVGDSVGNRIRAMSYIAAAAENDETIGIAIMAKRERSDGQFAIHVTIGRLPRREK